MTNQQIEQEIKILSQAHEYSHHDAEWYNNSLDIKENKCIKEDAKQVGKKQKRDKIAVHICWFPYFITICFIMAWWLSPIPMLVNLVSHIFGIWIILPTEPPGRPFKPQYPFSYAYRLLILSCVMLVMGFIRLFARDFNMPYLFMAEAFVTKKARKLPDPDNLDNIPKQIKKNIKKNSINFSKRQSTTCKTKFKGLLRLGLLAALSKASMIPNLTLNKDYHIQKLPKSHTNSYGFLNTSKIKDPFTIQCLRKYLEYTTENTLFGSNRMFNLIVDTGCSVTATSFNKDFVWIGDLKTPVTLEGVAGSTQVTQWGVV